jgi:hypothetical protein
MKSKLIAPCGMNCNLCLGYLREKNRCDGCNSDDAKKPQSCARCIIKNCEELKISGAKYCYKCEMFPCKRLKALDKRYRTKYGMSILDNLENIKTNGIRHFIADEKKRWIKGDEIFCVHRKTYFDLR